MNKVTLALLVLWLASLAIAGNVTYVVPTEEQVVDLAPMVSLEFRKPANGAGTISSHAMVATIQTGQELDMRGVENPFSGVQQTLIQRALESIQVAVDASTADAKMPDCVRFGFWRGKFDTEQAVPLKLEKTANPNLYATFGPKVLQVTRGGITLPVSVQGIYSKSADDTYRYMEVIAITGVQADVQFGHKTHSVRLVDSNGNFNYTDAARPVEDGGKVVAISRGDTIAIDTGDGKFGQGVQLFPYGQPVRVDGKWYKVSLSKDRGSIWAEPVDLPTATVKVNMPQWTCKLASKSGVLYLRGSKEPVEVPAGDYFLLDYKVFSVAGNPPADALRHIITVEGQIVIIARGQTVVAGEAKPISLAAGKEALLPIGAPLKAGITSEQTGGNVLFSLWMADCGGHKVVAIGGCKGPLPPPKISVVDATGKEVYQNTLEYG